VAVGNHHQTCFGSQLCYLALSGRCGRKQRICIDEVHRGCEDQDAIFTECAETLVQDGLNVSGERKKKKQKKVGVPAQVQRYQCENRCP